MLSFLRKIRRSMLVSGSVSKYLLYAIREIVLVVLGILIALQINNWNEARIDQKIEKEVLHNLAQCLETNNKTLEHQIDLNDRSDKASEIILTTIEKKHSYHDSLNTYFGYASNVDDTGSIFSYYGYEILKNTGMQIIRNQSLKNEIALLFSKHILDLQLLYIFTDALRLADVNITVLQYYSINKCLHSSEQFENL